MNGFVTGFLALQAKIKGQRNIVHRVMIKSMLMFIRGEGIKQHFRYCVLIFAEHLPSFLCYGMLRKKKPYTTLRKRFSVFCPQQLPIWSRTCTLGFFSESNKTAFNNRIIFYILSFYRPKCYTCKKLFNNKFCFLWSLWLIQNTK